MGGFKIDAMNEKENLERHIVLVAPEIHWSTGNIGRTCLGLDAWLHLIEPLGFSLESREVKRAGLDYWPEIKLRVWADFEAFLTHAAPRDGELAVFSKTGPRPYWNMPPRRRMFLVFGSETKGLPRPLLHRYKTVSYHVPTNRKIRSLNLSTVVGIALYESIRCHGPVHRWSDPA